MFLVLTTYGCGDAIKQSISNNNSISQLLGASFGMTTTQITSMFGNPLLTGDFTTTSGRPGTTYTWSDKEVLFFDSYKKLRVILFSSTNYNLQGLKVGDNSSKVIEKFGDPPKQRGELWGLLALNFWFYNDPNYIFALVRDLSGNWVIFEMGIWDRQNLSLSDPL